MFRSRSQPDSLFDLISKQRYGKAIGVVRKQLEERADNVQLRMQLADLLILDGEAAEASGILARLADELASSGFVAKAVAVLKKMQRVDPGRPGVEDRLARLIKSQQDELSGIRPAVKFGISSNREGSTESPAEPSSAESPVDSSAAEVRAPGIDRSRLFEDFSADELAAVIRGLDLLSFEPGGILFSEGEPGDSLMVLATGAVRVFVKDAEGRNREVRRLEAGEIFGEISLLTEIPRTATITAAEACEVLELDRSAVGAIAQDHPKVREILRDLCLARAGSDEEMAIRTDG